MSTTTMDGESQRRGDTGHGEIRDIPAKASAQSSLQSSSPLIPLSQDTIPEDSDSGTAPSTPTSSSASCLYEPHGRYSPALSVVLRTLRSPNTLVDWSEIPLTFNDYDVFESLIKRGEIDGQQRVQYEYSHEEQILSLRMAPTTKHQEIIHLIEELLLKKYLPYSNSAQSAFVESIVRYTGPTRVLEDENTAKKYPDSSWRLKNCAQTNPSFALEVALSQSTKNLAKRAEQLVMGSKAQIRTVLGIDADVNTGVARATIWRPAFNYENELTTVQSQTMAIRGCKPQGEEPHLQFSLNDFNVLENEAASMDLKKCTFSISATELREILESADQLQQAWDDDETLIYPSQGFTLHCSTSPNDSKRYALRSRAPSDNGT